MPLPPTTYMGLIRPVPGGDDDVWDDLLNQLLVLVDQHQHTVGQGQQIGVAAININGQFEINSNRIVEIAGASFDNLPTLPSTGARELFVSSGNLFYRNNSGTNVRITNGNTLDQTTVGGIAGDYSAVGAELAYVDTIDTYTHKQQLGAGVRQWAKVQSADISLYEHLANPLPGVPTNSVTLRSPTGLVGSYALTLPSALPIVQALSQIGPTGTMVASNTVPFQLTLTGGASLGANTTLTSGTLAVNLGATLSVAGAVDFSAATVFRRPPERLLLDVASGVAQGLAAYSTSGHTINFTGIGAWDMPISLRANERITEVIFYFRRDSGGTIQFLLRDINTATEAITVLCSKNVAAGVGILNTSLGVSPTTGSLPQTLLSGRTYWITMSANNLDNLIGVELVYDRP